MQAFDCYQGHTLDAIPIRLITKQEWEKQSAEDFNDKERNLLTSLQFKAKAGDVCIETTSEGKLLQVFLGAGEGESDAIQALAIAPAKLPSGAYRLVQVVSKSALLAWGLTQYRFDTFKKNEQKPSTLYVAQDDLIDLLKEASAVFLVRDLINTPANAMGPKELSQVCQELAEQGQAQFQEWVGEDLITANFPAVYTVGQASANAPRVLRLIWGDSKHPRIALVGKGVCFDSGGLNIKPSDGMRLMKKDMGGAAQVLGLAQWIMASQLPIYLDVIIPAVDNVISSSAYKPGDILRMRNGLTVEIDNTDAEGRLVLADALVLAAESKPEMIIDFATLTGAARIAVGTEISAMFANDDNLAQAVLESAKIVGDPVWQMPLFKGYEPMFASSIADMTNCASSAYGGAITAALFLQKYLSQDIPWLHFDVMAWNLRSKPGKPEGGEAMGIRAIMHYLRKKYGEVVS